MSHVTHHTSIQSACPILTLPSLGIKRSMSTFFRFTDGSDCASSPRFLQGDCAIRSSILFNRYHFRFIRNSRANKNSPSDSMEWTPFQNHKIRKLRMNLISLRRRICSLWTSQREPVECRFGYGASANQARSCGVPQRVAGLRPILGRGIPSENRPEA